MRTFAIKSDVTKVTFGTLFLVNAVFCFVCDIRDIRGDSVMERESKRIRIGDFERIENRKLVRKFGFGVWV